MTSELQPIDISTIPELAQLADEVRRTRRRRRLQQDQEDVAMLVPAVPAKRPRSRPTSANDPLWSIIGIVTDDGPGDVALNVDKYLADAYARTEP